MSYAATLSVANADQQLRPGMTATADIVTTAKSNVLLVPNAALRFKPADRTPAHRGGGGGIAGCARPARPRRGGQEARPRRSGAGATQTVYVKDADGQAQGDQVTTGETNGSVTEVDRRRSEARRWR